MALVSRERELQAATVMAVTTRNSAKRHCALPQHQTELGDVTSTPESSVTTEPCGPVPRFKLRVKELNICVALKQPWRSRGALARRERCTGTYNYLAHNPCSGAPAHIIIRTQSL